jgi:hypothetical protein
MAGTNITITGIDACLKAFQGLEGELRKNANGELRRASKNIASGIVDRLPGYAASTASPQAAAFAAAAGPKSDRYVVVAIPARKPRLSGLKKKSAAEAKNLAWAIEGGSDYPPFKRPAAGSFIAKHRDEIARQAIPEYTKALADIMRRYGLL